MKRVALLLALPVAAQAHIMPGVGAFYSGMLHAFLSPEQILPLLALALLAAQTKKPSGWLILFILPCAVLAGALYAPWSLHLSWVATLSLAVTAITGLLIAFAIPVPAVLACLLSATAGLLAGWFNALDAGDASLLSGFGVALSALLVLAYIAALTSRFLASRLPIGIRIGGSWLAAIGIMTLALQ